MAKMAMDIDGAGRCLRREEQRLLRDAHLGSIWEGTGNIIAFAWEGARIDQKDQMHGDARRLLASRLVLDHCVSAGDLFRLTENAAQGAIASLLLGEPPVGMREVGELLQAA